jgi:hypothetical protein
VIITMRFCFVLLVALQWSLLVVAFTASQMVSRRVVFPVNIALQQLAIHKASSLSSTSLPYQPSFDGIVRSYGNNSDSVKRAVAVLGGYSAVRYFKQAGVKPLEAVSFAAYLASTLQPAWGGAAFCGGFAAVTSLPRILAHTTPTMMLVATMLSLEIWERYKILSDYGGRTGASAACAVGALALYLSQTVRGLPALDYASVPAAVMASAADVLNWQEARTELMRATALALSAALATLGLRGLLPALQEPAPDAYAASTVAAVAGATPAVLLHGKPPALSSATVAMIAAKLFAVWKLRAIATSFGVGNTAIRTLDPLAFVLMGSCLGLRGKHNYNRNYLWNLLLQSAAGSLMLFGLSGTPLVRVGGMLGATAVVSTLVVNALCTAACKFGEVWRLVTVRQA